MNDQISHNDSTQTETSSAWQGNHVYLMASACLLLGLCIGYFLRGSQSPAKAAAVAAPAAGAATESVPTATAAGPTPEQIKDMGNKLAEPILAELQKSPNDPELLRKLASIYFRSAQYPEAVDYYERAVKTNPTSEGYVSLSNAYHHAGDDDKAFEALNKALSIDPKSANALFNVGMLDWQVKNDPKGAIQAWERLLKLNPNHPRRAQVEMMIAKAKQHLDIPATN